MRLCWITVVSFILNLFPKQTPKDKLLFCDMAFIFREVEFSVWLVLSKKIYDNGINPRKFIILSFQHNVFTKHGRFLVLKKKRVDLVRSNPT